MVINHYARFPGALQHSPSHPGLPGGDQRVSSHARLACALVGNTIPADHGSGVAPSALLADPGSDPRIYVGMAQRRADPAAAVTHHARGADALGLQQVLVSDRQK